jgi:hypothetical protein
MFLKLALSAGLLIAVGMGTAQAQTTTGETRNPTLGDPGTSVKQPHHRPFRKHVVSDKPGPGQTTGNTPDRAAAGGGGH